MLYCFGGRRKAPPTAVGKAPVKQTSQTHTHTAASVRRIKSPVHLRTSAHKRAGEEEAKAVAAATCNPLRRQSQRRVQHTPLFFNNHARIESFHADHVKWRDCVMLVLECLNWTPQLLGPASPTRAGESIPEAPVGTPYPSYSATAPWCHTCRMRSHTT